MPKDIVGHEIMEGDEVVFGQAQHMHLLRGTVIAVNPKTVKIRYTKQKQRYGGGWEEDVQVECNRAFEDVVIVSDV